MTRRVLGLMRIGDSDIALDAIHLVEVVQSDATLAPRPLAPRWALGTLLLRGLPIPTIDLGRLLELDISDCPREAGDFIAIIDYRGSRVGMRVSHVSDVINAEPDQLHELTKAGGQTDALTPQLLQHVGFERPIYVLDTEALFGLPGMLAVHVEAAERHHQQLEAAHTPADAALDPKRWLVVDCDDTRLALETSVVQEVATCGPIKAPVIELPGYLGNVTLRGATLPLFDPKTLIDQPSRRMSPSHLAILDGGNGRVALAIDRIATLTVRGQANWLPIPPGAGYSPTVSGLVPGADAENDALALDPTKLFSAINVNALAQLHSRLAGDEAKIREQRDWQRFAFVHFRCGGDYVTLLDQLEAVDTAPTHYQRSQHKDGHLLGAWRRQGQSVALVDLRSLLGNESASPADHVLIVDGDHGLVGFLVDATGKIDYLEAPAASFTIRWRGDSRPQASPVEAAKRLVSVGEGEARQVMALMCLKTLAKRLTQPHSVSYSSRFSEDASNEVADGASDKLSVSA